MSSDKIAELVLGLTVSGIISTIVWLFRWVDRVDLRLHDFDRDLKHVRREHLGLSENVARLDLQNERIIDSYRKALASTDRRIIKGENRLYALEVRLKL